MIVVDTSALIAIIKNEQTARVCSEILASEPYVIISAGTLVEARIVAIRAGCQAPMEEIIASSIAEVASVTAYRAQLAAAAYAQWGKGLNRASLNFGDCFSYATAKEFDCPLLYLGDDFARTDVEAAISASSG